MISKKNKDNRQEDIKEELCSEEENKSWNDYSGCISIFFCAFFVMLLATVMAVVWMYKPEHDTTWSEINVHGTLSIIGPLTLTGFSMILFRGVPCMEFKYATITHILLNIASLILLFIAYANVVQFKSYEVYLPLLYSAHSWIGLTALALCIFQVCNGVVAFKFTRSDRHINADIVDSVHTLHGCIGMVAYIAITAACISGILEKSTAGIQDNDYEMTGDTFNGIILGMACFFSCLLTIYCICDESLKSKGLQLYESML